MKIWMDIVSQHENGNARKYFNSKRSQSETEYCALIELIDQEMTRNDICDTLNSSTFANVVYPDRHNMD